MAKKNGSSDMEQLANILKWIGIIAAFPVLVWQVQNLDINVIKSNSVLKSIITLAYCIIVMGIYFEIKIRRLSKK